MVGKQPLLDLPSRGKNGFSPPTSPRDVGGDLEVKRHLEKFAPWLKVVRLLRGTFFWAALALIGALLTVVAVLSWQGWQPGPLGSILTALGMMVFWIALMTAFAGWMLRSSK